MCTYRSISFSKASDLTKKVVRTKVEASKGIMSEGGSPRLVNEADNLDHFLVLGLRQELCEDSKVVKSAFSVEDTLLPGKPVYTLANAT